METKRKARCSPHDRRQELWRLRRRLRMAMVDGDSFPMQQPIADKNLHDTCCRVSCPP